MITRILAYHSIGSEGSGEVGSELYSVDVAKFREQVEYVVNKLLRRTYVPRPTSHVPRPTITITFDDGLLNNYTAAYPILKEFGLLGYFFILVGRVGAHGYMSWQQIEELKAAGMTIGSHGMTHRILTTLSGDELDYELRESKRILDEKLNSETDALSIPRGFHNKKVLAKASEAGYKTIFTSRNRIAVKAGWDMKKFVKVINNGLSFKDKTVELFKVASKHTLGAAAYDKLRNVVLR